MLAYMRSVKWTTAVLTVTVLITMGWLWAAPVEKTLGTGIKIVYLHVALIWSGMIGLLLAGVLGIWLLLAGLRTAAPVRSGPSRLWRGLRAVSWVGFGLFTLGTVVSLGAEIVNWGGIFWSEPRTASILQILAVAVIVQVLNNWPLDGRLQGLLNAGLAVFMVWSTGRAELVLHPNNPIGTSDSAGIQGTFYGLFILLTLMAIWLTGFLYPRVAPQP